MTSGTPQLTFYNTLTRKKEPFVPIDAANVRLYACGPTVYDFAHIGNGRMAIVFDLLFRLLRQVYGPDHVTYVRNITDVDDKINARAARDFPGLPLNEAIRKVTEKTAAQYQSDVTALGCLEPTVQPRATDNIDGMVAIIQLLLDKGHAYVVRGAEGREALFDVSSMEDYGELSRRDAASKVAGSRIEVKEYKRNPEDFVLWKESDPSEPGWDGAFVISEVNRAELDLNDTSITIRGRPGWHIECSAMSERYLGQLFDIHGGGLDLIFPHHENEIAQSRCAHGTHAMANVWMHNGFLQVEGEKMSKSLGNFFTIAQLLETTDFGGRKWPGEVLRLAMLMTHYREPIDFTVRRLEEAAALLSKWRNPIRFGSVATAEIVPDVYPDGFIQALGDDLNSVRAIATLHNVADRAFGVSVGRAEAVATDDFFQHPFSQLYNALLLLGVDLLVQPERDEADDALTAAMVNDRLLALAAKDFATADRIRAELAEQGIALMDSKDPATGERVTKWEIKR